MQLVGDAESVMALLRHRIEMALGIDRLGSHRAVQIWPEVLGIISRVVLIPWTPGSKPTTLLGRVESRR